MSAASVPNFAPIFEAEQERQEGQRTSHREEQPLAMASALAEETDADLPLGQGIVFEEAECKEQAASLQQAAASHSSPGLRAQQPPRRVTAVPQLITSLDALPKLSSCDESFLRQGRQAWLGKSMRPGHNEADEDDEDLVQAWWDEGDSIKQRQPLKKVCTYTEHAVMKKRESLAGIVDDELLPDAEVLASALGATTAGDSPDTWPNRGATTEFPFMAAPRARTAPLMMHQVGETIVRPRLAQGGPGSGAAGEEDFVEELMLAMRSTGAIGAATRSASR